jgi:hypothetical protein
MFLLVHRCSWRVGVLIGVLVHAASDPLGEVRATLLSALTVEFEAQRQNILDAFEELVSEAQEKEA